MDIGAIIIIMIVAVILILTFYIIGVYNKLIDARNRVENQFEQIYKELKKINNSILKLIETIKKYAKHEEKLLKEITDVRDQIIKTKEINDEIKMFNRQNKVLNKLFLVSESYSELKNDTNFIELLKDLKAVENKIEYASSFYNEEVSNYNNLIKQFPMNIVGKIFNLKKFSSFKYNSIGIK